MAEIEKENKEMGREEAIKKDYIMLLSRSRHLANSNINQRISYMMEGNYLMLSIKYNCPTVLWSLIGNGLIKRNNWRLKLKRRLDELLNQNN